VIARDDLVAGSANFLDLTPFPGWNMWWQVKTGFSASPLQEARFSS
jgi:hypothetical protein